MRPTLAAIQCIQTGRGSCRQVGPRPSQVRRYLCVDVISRDRHEHPDPKLPSEASHCSRKLPNSTLMCSIIRTLARLGLTQWPMLNLNLAAGSEGTHVAIANNATSGRYSGWSPGAGSAEFDSITCVTFAPLSMIRLDTQVRSDRLANVVAKTTNTPRVSLELQYGNAWRWGESNTHPRSCTQASTASRRARGDPSTQQSL